MTYPDLHLIVWLLVAHFMGDFTFQPRHWIDEKRRRKWKSPFLYYHVIVHFLLAAGVIGWLAGGFNWKGILGALVIASGHFVFDLMKVYYIKYIEKEREVVGIERGMVFLWDQLGHFCVLFLVGLWLHNAMWMEASPEPITKVLIIALGYYFILYPASAFIDLSTQDWQYYMESHDQDDGLPMAGRTIGQLERMLALTFILLGQFTALGFLIGAKSIFRFGDLTRGLQHKKTEYILIGTLLSFSVVVIVGLILSMYINN